MTRDAGDDFAVDALLEHTADAGAPGNVAAGQFVDGDGGELAGEAVLHLDVTGDVALFENLFDDEIVIGERGDGEKAAGRIDMLILVDQRFGQS